MLSSTGAKLFQGALLFGIITALAGCFPPPSYTTPVQQPVQQVHYTQPAPVVHTTTAYTPQYYNGYVVYFDARGYPFYYLNGSIHYVPRSYSGYSVLINHYRVNRVAYRSWYSTQGINFRALGVNIGL